MGYIDVNIAGSFTKKGNRRFTAMEHGHAHAVAETIAYLSTAVLPAAIEQDHRLHDEGAKPSAGFDRP